jgi:hypothetical protein
MLVSIARAALRRRPFSFSVTLVLGTAFTSLLGAPVPAFIVLWAMLSLLGLEVWFTAESAALRRLGVRRPLEAEAIRLQPAAKYACGVEVVLADQSEPWVYPSLRSVVISSALLDVVEDQGLIALVAHAAEMRRLAVLVGEPMVWLGNLPLVGAYLVARALVRVGELLAGVVGSSLILPGLLFPNGFRRYVGGLFGAVFVGLIGSSLISYGAPAVGLSVLVAWAVVPGLRALLAWETRRAEALADQAVIAAGLGSFLRQGLEVLSWADELPRPRGALGLLARGGAPIRTPRMERIERALKLAASAQQS